MCRPCLTAFGEFARRTLQADDKRLDIIKISLPSTTRRTCRPSVLCWHPAPSSMRRVLALPPPLLYSSFTISIRSCVFSQTRARRGLLQHSKDAGIPRHKPRTKARSRGGSSEIQDSERGTPLDYYLYKRKRVPCNVPSIDTIASRPRTNSPQNRDQAQKTSDVLRPQKISGHVTHPAPAAWTSGVAPTIVAPLPHEVVSTNCGNSGARPVGKQETPVVLR